MTGDDGSRYSHCLIAPVFASRMTPSRRNAQQSYATDTKKLAGSRLNAADLAADQRHCPAEAHGTDAQGVHGPHDLGFERGEPLVRVHIVQRPEELLLRLEIARRAIAADGDANGAGRAALALRLPDGVQDALADAVERAIGAAEMRQLGRQRVLRVHVLAAAALQDQPDLDLVVLLPLIEVKDRRAGPEVVAGVGAGDRVDRVGPQLAASRGLGDGLADLLSSSRSGSRRPGVLISKVGIPVSWQIAPSPLWARSMFWAMMASAWDERVASGSSSRAWRMAARTSGGRSVDVLTMRSRTESKKAGSMPAV